VCLDPLDQILMRYALAIDPLTPSLSPRGESFQAQTYSKESGIFKRPLSPREERQSEGGLWAAILCGADEST
jgi:hypothetical protein